MRDSRVYQPERSDLLNSFATPVREPAVARGLRGLVEPVAVAADSGKEGSGDFRCNQGFRDFFAVRWRGAFVVSTLLLALIVGASPPIALPDAATSVARVEAGGVQIYRCSSSPPATPAWTLDHPAATLYAEDGTIFGMHGAGPSWTASDGSSILPTGPTRSLASCPRERPRSPGSHSPSCATREPVRSPPFAMSKDTTRSEASHRIRRRARPSRSAHSEQCTTARCTSSFNSPGRRVPVTRVRIRNKIGRLTTRRDSSMDAPRMPRAKGWPWSIRDFPFTQRGVSSMKIRSREPLRTRQWKALGFRERPRGRCAKANGCISAAPLR